MKKYLALRAKRAGTYTIVSIALCTALSFSANASERAFECLIVPNQTVEIRSPTDGLIHKMLVKRGDQVKRGQVLVILDSKLQTSAVEIAKYRSQMTGQIESSRSRLEFAKKKLARTQELQKKDLISDHMMDEAEAEKLVAEAEVLDATESQNLAKQEYLHALNILNQKKIRSPLNGVVVDRMLNPGDLAESGTGPKPILELAQVDPLLVEVSLPLDAYGQLEVGMTANIKPEGMADSYSASVSIVDSVFDAASGLFGVRLQLDNSEGKIPAGIRCQVQFDKL